MKKILALALCAALAMAFLAGCAPKEAPPEGGDAGAEKTVYIGVFEPTSGENGAGGKQEILGMQYANSLTPTVEIGGEAYKVELVYADNASSTDKAPTAAQLLVSKNVSVVLGSYGSGVSMAASSVFQDAGIPAIGVTCTNPQVTQGNKHYFRICFIEPFQGTVQANYAYDVIGAKTVYTLAELGNDYDVGLATYFARAFEAKGGKVVADTFPKGTADFSTYLANAKTAGAEVIFAPTSISYATQIIEQSASQGSTIPLMAGDTWDSNLVVGAAQGKDVQVLVSTFYQEGGNPEFDAALKEFINSDPKHLSNNGGNDMISAVSVMGYDAYYVALEALKAAGKTDGPSVNEALWTVKHTGISGEIVFDQEIGDAMRDTAYIKAVNTETGAWDLKAEQGVETEPGTETEQPAA